MNPMSRQEFERNSVISYLENYYGITFPKDGKGWTHVFDDVWLRTAISKEDMYQLYLDWHYSTQSNLGKLLSE